MSRRKRGGGREKGRTAGIGSMEVDRTASAKDRRASAKHAAANDRGIALGLHERSARRAYGQLSD